MGGEKRYNSEGGFDYQTFKQVGITTNGIKILEGIGNSSAKLPMYSNTPFTMYASRDSKTGMIKQISVYGGEDGRIKIKDIDIGHEHTNKLNGMYFGKNEIHIHTYDKNGIRSNEARKPSAKERQLIMQARYGKGS